MKPLITAITGLLLLSMTSCLPVECCDGPPTPPSYPSIRVVDRIGHDLMDPTRKGTYPHDSIHLAFTVDSTTFSYSPIITESKFSNNRSSYTIHIEKVLDRKSRIRKVGTEELVIQWNSRIADTLIWNVIPSIHENSEFELDSLKLNGKIQENNYSITIRH